MEKPLDGSLRHCAECGWLMVHGPGIGDYCPNPDCDNLDGPAKEDGSETSASESVSPQGEPSQSPPVTSKLHPHPEGQP